MSERIKRLEETIREAVGQAPAPMQAVVQGLQALRGIALISAVCTRRSKNRPRSSA